MDDDRPADKRQIRRFLKQRKRAEDRINLKIVQRMKELEQDEAYLKQIDDEIERDGAEKVKADAYDRAKRDSLGQMAA